MKTRVKDKVMVPLSTYVSGQNKIWLAQAARRQNLKLYQFLDNLLTEARRNKGA